MRTDVKIPERILALPRDHRGYPVPFFAVWKDEAGKPTDPGQGKPDLTIADGRAAGRCAARRVCWICAQPLGYWLAFVGGPESCKNRAFSDGPMHEECALFSVQVCPHLLNPNAKRRPLREGEYEPPGMIRKNPGVIAVYLTRSFGFQGHWERNMVLGGMFFPAAPKQIRWFREGVEVPE